VGDIDETCMTAPSAAVVDDNSEDDDDDDGVEVLGEHDDIDDDIDEAELVAAYYPAPGESTSHHFMITGIVQ